MNKLKTRLQALALLDRAFTAMSDDELTATIASLPEDHRAALDRIATSSGDPEEGSTAPVAALREAVARGRMSGGMEQVTTILTDPCLAQCIKALGDHADNPTEEQLKAVTPALVEAHGLATVRLMLAGSVAGEAAASPMLIRVLKTDPELALPAEERRESVVLPAAHADEELRAKRKAAREAKRLEARKSREQQLRARNRS